MIKIAILVYSFHFVVCRVFFNIWPRDSRLLSLPEGLPASVLQSELMIHEGGSHCVIWLATRNKLINLIYIDLWWSGRSVWQRRCFLDVATTGIGSRQDWIHAGHERTPLLRLECCWITQLQMEQRWVEYIKILHKILEKQIRQQASHRHQTTAIPLFIHSPFTIQRRRSKRWLSRITLLKDNE